jgi:hypothetical protein
VQKIGVRIFRRRAAGAAAIRRRALRVEEDRPEKARPAAGDEGGGHHDEAAAAPQHRAAARALDERRPQRHAAAAGVRRRPSRTVCVSHSRYCSEGNLAQFLLSTVRLPDAALWDLAGQLLRALCVFEQHRIVSEFEVAVGDQAAARHAYLDALQAALPACDAGKTKAAD